MDEHEWLAQSFKWTQVSAWVGSSDRGDATSPGRGRTRFSISGGGSCRGYWRQTARHRRGLNNRGVRHRVGDDLVDEGLQIVDVPYVGPGDETILAGDPVALDDLGEVAENLGHLLHLARNG